MLGMKKHSPPTLHMLCALQQKGIIRQTHADGVYNR